VKEKLFLESLNKDAMIVSVTSTTFAGFLLGHLKRGICQQTPRDAGSPPEHIIVFLTKSLKKILKAPLPVMDLLLC